MVALVKVSFEFVAYPAPLSYMYKHNMIGSNDKYNSSRGLSLMTVSSLGFDTW
jgi:hypothetical protein